MDLAELWQVKLNLEFYEIQLYYLPFKTKMRQPLIFFLFVENLIFLCLFYNLKKDNAI